MSREDLAWIDSLCLDQCLARGVLLDGGELEMALEWQVSRKVTGARPKPRNQGDDAVILMLAAMR